MAIAEKVATPKRTFLAENVLVLPLWGGMIFAPNNKYVRAVMEGYSVIIIAALGKSLVTAGISQNVFHLLSFQGRKSHEPADNVLVLSRWGGMIFVPNNK